MPVIKNRLRDLRRRPECIPLRRKSRRTPQAGCKLDTFTRLIAPAHSLTLPSLEGVKDRFEFSLGCDAALPLARALIGKGLLREEHLQAAKSPVSALEVALAEIVNNNFCGAQDEFGIDLCISDRLEDYRKLEDVLFFVWNNSADPQYIPLRPVFEKLAGNPYREALLASVYQWLYGAASRAFDPFGFDEAKNVYAWRKESYTEARENGEDVDLEGEVEASDPAKVVSYIRDSEKLVLKDREAAAAVESITDKKLRAAFVSAKELAQIRKSSALTIGPALRERCIACSSC